DPGRPGRRRGSARRACGPRRRRVAALHLHRPGRAAVRPPGPRRDRRARRVRRDPGRGRVLRRRARTGRRHQSRPRVHGQPRSFPLSPATRVSAARKAGYRRGDPLGSATAERTAQAEETRSMTDLEQRGINVIRGLALDAVEKAKSGHQGTALALAPLAHVLFTRIMRYDTATPEWPDRDRFVLSNGHVSALLYSMLHLTGFGLELSDLEQFRQWGSN